jgi:hypothetical protein
MNHSDSILMSDQWKQVDGGITVPPIIIIETHLDIMKLMKERTAFSTCLPIETLRNKIRYMFILKVIETIQSL